MFPYIEFMNQKMGVFPLCIGFALLMIALLTYRQQKKIAEDPVFENKIMVAIPFSLLSGAVTAYLSDVLLRGGWRALLAPWGFGFTFYGWLTGCIIFYCVYGRFNHLRPTFLLNFFLPQFALAQAIGRIGCFCGGCCYGRPVVRMGVSYPQGSLPYRMYGDTPLCPVQLVECAYLLLIFLILWFGIPFRKRAAWYLILMSSGRFVIEFFRGDNRGGIGCDWFSPAQFFSIVYAAVGIILLFKKEATPKENIENVGRKCNC